MTRSNVLLFVMLALGTLAPRPAADITGNWAATFTTPIGEMHYVYEFAVKGTELTGKAKSDMGESKLTEGKVEGDTVTFVEMLDGSIRIDYTGTIVSADEIKFSRVVGEFGTETLVAKRIKAAKH